MTTCDGGVERFWGPLFGKSVPQSLSENHKGFLTERENIYMMIYDQSNLEINCQKEN